MSGVSKKLLGTTSAAGGGPTTFIEDVFSTDVYLGNGTTLTITNGIDLAGEGGLVWGKNRTVGNSHRLTDTVRGVTKYLASNSTAAEATENTVTSFNSDGFTLGNSSSTNRSGDQQVTWTFRKAPRFFDVVTYTGDGVAGREVPHNLGSEVGFFVVKRTDATGNWPAYHRSMYVADPDGAMQLNSTGGSTSFYGPAYFGLGSGNVIPPTDSVFTIGSDVNVNASGGTYVAYLYAHDPLGPSGDGSDGLISCGTYTEGASAQEINLGFEPQWLLFKKINGAGSWYIFDTMRGLSHTDLAYLVADTGAAEGNFNAGYVKPTATGFIGPTAFFSSGSQIAYVAIRRGPMRVPTSGTEVFSPVARTGTGSIATVEVGFAPDFLTTFYRSTAGQAKVVFDKMRGPTQYLNTAATTQEADVTTNGLISFNNTSFTTNANGYANNSGSTFINHVFRRAPGFFDVVAYEWNGVTTRDVEHSLGVAPEMYIVKRRNSTTSWFARHKDFFGTNGSIVLNSTAATAMTGVFTTAGTTSTTFPVANDGSVNASGGTYIAYLFATLPGVSKVGSYTGNGSSQTIDCGFTSGARFILIKRTDSTGDWYVWDTARGIVTGNDPHLSLNTTAAEVTTNDSIDPDSSGFIVNQVAATNINVSSASYIFYAIA